EFQPLQLVMSHVNFAYFNSLGKDFTLSLYQPPQV
ncbi:DUF6660 family protein, partial [Flagellimonas flava]